jgi:hypothetical protein
VVISVGGLRANKMAVNSFYLFQAGVFQVGFKKQF